MLNKIKNWLFKDEYRKVVEKDREADTRIKRATELINNLNKKIDQVGISFVHIEPYDVNDIKFLSKLYEIINCNEFKFHFKTVKDNIVASIISGTEKDAVEAQGKLKGLNEFYSATYRAAQAYESMSNAKQESQVIHE